jgi:hypothetical protein
MPDDQRWEQPAFTGPTFSGAVLQPGETSFAVAPQGIEEQRLRMIRRLVLPLMLVFGLVTGLWWQVIFAAVLTSAVLRHRIRQLRNQRLASAYRVTTGWAPTVTDLR